MKIDILLAEDENLFLRALRFKTKTWLLGSKEEYWKKIIL